MRCSRCRVPRGARSSSFPSVRSRWTTCVSRSMESESTAPRGAHGKDPRTDAVLNVLADVRVSRAQDVPPAQGEPWGWIVLGETGAEASDIHCSMRADALHRTLPAVARSAARCRLCRPVGCADGWLTTEAPVLAGFRRLVGFVSRMPSIPGFASSVRRRRRHTESAPGISSAPATKADGRKCPRGSASPAAMRPAPERRSRSRAARCLRTPALRRGSASAGVAKFRACWRCLRPWSTLPSRSATVQEFGTKPSPTMARPRQRMPHHPRFCSRAMVRWKHQGSSGNTGCPSVQRSVPPHASDLVRDLVPM